MGMSSSESKPPLILIAEDERDIRDLIEFTLVVAGYRVHQCVNGAEVITYLEQATEFPDLILLDVRMPKMTGYEVVKEIRANPRWRHLAVAILSAKGQDDEILYGFQVGVDRYLLKPFSPDGLTSYVKAFFTRSISPIMDTRILVLPSVLPSDRGLIEEVLLQEFDLASIRQSVAVYRPNLILLTKQIDTSLATLFTFELSQSIPIIAALHEHPEAAWYTYFQQGASIVYTSNEVEEARQAIKLALNLYHTPSLIPGSEWLVLIATANHQFANTLETMLKKSFLVDILRADTTDDCIEQAKDEIPDLILIDETLDPPDALTLLQKLAPLDLPMIVFTEQGSEQVTRRLCRLNVRGYLLKSEVEQQLIPTLERLSRWLPPAPAIPETWAKYTATHAENRFELEIREKNPTLAAQIQEFGVLSSGLIHDLRNAFIVLKTKLQAADTTIQQTLAPALNYANFVFESIAAIRFKGGWRPTLLPDKNRIGLAEIFQEAAILAETKAVLPAIPLVQLIGDKEQLIFALASVLAATQAKQLEVETAENSHQINFIFQNLAPDSANLFQMTSIPSLSAYKFLLHHSATFTSSEDQLIVQLVTGGWPSEMILRQQIAILADDVDAMKEKIAMLPDLPTGVNISPLISAAAKELVAALQKFMRLVIPLGEAGLPMLSTGRYALLLARDMLAVSEQIKPTLQTVPLKPVIAQLLDIRKDYLRGIQVEVVLHPETIAVHGDELGLLQILVNLVTNAVEAMRGEGKITIRAAAENQTINLQVSDTGSGISPENLDKIFALFFTTKSGHERGVGLHVVASLVQQMKGSVRVDSVVGQGTTFMIKLPMAEEK